VRFVSEPALLLIENHLDPRQPSRVSSYSRPASRTERDYYEAFIRRMVRERRRIGLSQEDVDARIGVTPGLCAKWENMLRLPGAFMLVCWANTLGVTLVPLGEDEERDEIWLRAVRDPAVGRSLLRPR
jgi:ribosome-binding protein aMBF1 (putative translation factor)